VPETRDAGSQDAPIPDLWTDITSNNGQMGVKQTSIISYYFAATIITSFTKVDSGVRKMPAAM
jgi:hypothetical protein